MSRSIFTLRAKFRCIAWVHAWDADGSARVSAAAAATAAIIASGTTRGAGLRSRHADLQRTVCVL